MTRQQENIEKALKNQEAIKNFQGTEAYKLLIEPLKEKIDSLKHAYAVKAKDAPRFDGLYEGLTFVLDLIDGYLSQGELAQESQKRMLERKRKESEEIDSTNL